MGELRKHYFMDKWSTIAEIWSKRPYHFTDNNNEFEEECPFCRIRDPEKEKEREVMKLGEKGKWKIRVLKNKYPVMDTNNSGKVIENKGLLHSKEAYGYQEVVIESPAHNFSLAEASEEKLMEILGVIAQREKELIKDSKIQQVLVFHNQGPMSGASLEHSHSQILAFNVIPMAIVNETQEADAYRERNSSCAHCDIAVLESKAERLIESNENSVSFAHYSPEFPLETTILPFRHVNHLYELNEQELKDTVKQLKVILQGISKLEMSYNIVFVLSPKGKDLHLHIRIFPRFFHSGPIQGLQLFFSSIAPEKAAKFFKGELTQEQIRGDIE